MIRATTGGVMRGYRNNLMNSFIASNKARDRVLTQRNFASYAEAPADAARAFRLRMSRLTVNSQYKICEDTYYKYQGAFSCLDTVDKLIDTENGGTQLQTLKSTTLKMLNDPTGDARTQLGKVLDEMSETIIQNMNQKYGDTFIFAGADGYNVPFEVNTLKDGTKQLLYRGVPVDAAVPKTMADENGDPIKVNDAGVIDPNGNNYLSADTELVKAPNFIPNAGGGNVMVDANGQVDAAGTNYLLPDTPTLDQAGYDAALAAGEDINDFSKYTADDGSIHFFRKADAVTMSQDEYNSLTQSARADAADPTKPYTLTKDGVSYYIVKNDDDVITKEEYDTACTDVEKLDYMVNKEKRFVDIGLGFQENEDGKLIESSAFNEALNGLTFLGYGLDENGDPKNIYSIVQRLKEITESVPDGEDWSQATYDEFDALVGKLEDASSNFKTEYANMDAGTLKLKNNLDILEDNFYNLDTQTANLEDVDMVEAISSFIWAEYAYNAALKVGNSILSQSLMDYMT